MSGEGPLMIEKTDEEGLYDTYKLEHYGGDTIVKYTEQDNIAATLLQRGSTHGPFHLQASISQSLKNYMSDADLNSVQREALEMIMHKISRILVGNSDFVDHWHDIAGYATLVVKDLESE